MPRNARCIQNTSLFHILVEGSGNERIFPSKEFREIYLCLALDNIRDSQVHLIAYCIMDTHAHLVLYADEVQSVSDFMSQTNKLYARKFNTLTGRTGCVFNGRFKSQPILSPQELGGCIEFVHANPVARGVSKRASDYEYSSIHCYTEGAEPVDLEFVATLLTLEDMKNGRENTKRWLECADTEYESFEEVFKELMRRNRITSPQMLLADDKLITQIVIELKTRCGLSIRALSELLGVGRETLRKVIVANS